MTLFGEKLKDIIDSNGLNIYRLSQQAGIERTVIYKIISGNRIPDAEYVGKLADAMPISPFERDELLNAYNISKDGEFLYNQRIQVHDLVERMSTVRGMQTDGTGDDGRSFGSTAAGKTAGQGEIRTATGIMSINNLIEEMLSRELASDNPCVKFILPYNYAFFYDILFLKYIKTPGLKAECLFEFYKNRDIVRGKRNVNLDVMHTLAPFIMHSGNFNAGYIYSMYPENSRKTLPMPYFIISSTQVITLTADIKTAVIYDNAGVTACYREIFDNMMATGRALIGRVATIEDAERFYMINLDKSTGVVGFGSHPCIAIYYDRPLLQAHLPEYLPDREQTVNRWVNVCNDMLALSKKSTTISCFAMRGLELFAEKGVIQTIDENYFTPYSPAERAMMISRIIGSTEDDTMRYRVIDSSKLKIPEYFYADVFSGSHMNIVTKDAGGSFSTVAIYESSIVEAFYDFVTNAVHSDICYSKEDTLKLLRRALERVREPE